MQKALGLIPSIAKKKKKKLRNLKIIFLMPGKME
jgi:hypothetical protein